MCGGSCWVHLNGAGEEVESVDDAVALAHSWLCEILVEELDGV